MNIVLIILIFGIIVFFHELGHFIVAKLNKIAVVEFSVGLGPKIFSFEKKETKYSLRVLPLGGYCLMLGEGDGESEEAEKNENSFSNKSVWARMAVILAGPMFNFILAFFFAIILIHYTGCDPATLSYVAEGSPAMEAGIKEGDTMLSLKSQDASRPEKIYNYRELLLYKQIHDPKLPLTMEMERPDGTRYTTTVVPEVDENGNYMFGVAGGYIASAGIGDDIKYGALEIRYWLKATLSSLRMIFTGRVKSTEVMGPVGVGNAFGDIMDEVKETSDTRADMIINTILNMLNWCILLSVNLGVMNLLPIPALDGGKFLFLLIEAVRRKKISADKEATVTLIGFVILICLMVIVFANDIKNVFFK